MSWLECHRISLTAVGSYRSYCFAWVCLRVRLDALSFSQSPWSLKSFDFKIPDFNLTVERQRWCFSYKRSGEDSNLWVE